MDLLFLACIILFPIVPAYLLFQALPSSRASVKGTLHGMQLKLTGAFAGYFAVLLLVMSTYEIWHPSYRVWTIKGRLVDQQGRSIQPLSAQDVSLVPEGLHLFPDGSFSLRVMFRGDDYPTLSLTHGGFFAPPRYLNPRNKQSPFSVDAQGIAELGDIKLISSPLMDRPYYADTAAPPETPSR